VKALPDWRCLIGLHRRSISRVRRDGDRIRSLCRRCGKPMVKDAKGWHVTDEPAADPPVPPRPGNDPV